MADIRAYLKSQNLSDEDLTYLMAKPEYTAVYERLASEAEAGRTALLNAQQIEENLKTWNQNEVIPYVRKADESVAATSAKLAEMQTYLRTMKERGYEVPDAYLAQPTASPASTTSTAAATAAGVDDARLRSELDGQGRAYMQLNDAVDEAHELLGRRISRHAEYEDYTHNRRPAENMTAYLDRKYDLPTLRKQRDEKAEAARIAKVKAEGVEEYKRAHPQTANPELRSAPRATKFDRIATDDSRKQSWLTRAGRTDATKARIEKYANLATMPAREA